MEIIGTLFGAAAVLCFFPLAVKYPLRKLGLDKANAYLMKLHEAASAGFWLFGIIHMTAELLTHKCNAFARISGFFSLGLSTWLIADCHIAKNHEKKMKRHRIYSLALTFSLILHGIFAGQKI